MIIDELKSNGIIENGEFKLKSGIVSNTYIDIKRIISYPDLHLSICNELAKKIGSDKDLICGIPYGAISFASYISICYSIPMILLRKDKKDYGTGRLIEGNYKKGEKVVLIEDVVTTGNSIIETAKKLEEEGLIISQIITVFSRSDNINLMYKNIAIEYLYHINEIRDNKNVRGIIKDKKTKICLAADVNSMRELFKLIREVGFNICILKIHSDIIADFHINYEYNRDLLKKYKKFYNFKIWEDRKFADIGHIMNQQIHTSISEWADIVSVHPIAGKASVKEIKNIDMFLIAEMSTGDHLMNNKYQQDVLEIAEQTDNVIGIVCQHKLSDKLLHIVPGISLDKLNDESGQKYSRPAERDFADIYVIGRAIYMSDNPKKALNEYRKKGT